VHRSLLDEELIDRLRSRVAVVMTWPVDDLATLDAVLDLGANGVISNEPDVLAEVLQRRGAASSP
jgi:glycerophosphoryl diester phosphodiesterase